MPQKGPIDLATIREMIHPDDRESVFRIAEEAILGGVRPDAEHRIVRPSGDVRTVHSQGDLKRDASGRPYQMFGTVQDITDRKRTEEALRRSQFYLSEGQRLAHMGSWAFNALGSNIGLLSCSNSRSGSEPQPPPVEGVSGPRPSRKIGTVHGRKFRDDGGAAWIRLHEADCSTRWRDSLRTVRGCAGGGRWDGARGSSGQGIDVTEQELLTQELRREQAYLAEAQSLTHTGSWACNLVTRQIFHSSDEAVRLYGFDPSRDPPFDVFTTRFTRKTSLL